ncbi:RNA-directed DNA polymerase, eukaryota [Tanacetum coccineum]|uniref:RNA-directed DNA polymerase, eukaryota n=1 Tax=Tanacetum coccineum TaxID=301880 RepID=A0ABQ5C9D0_9ASTR
MIPLTLLNAYQKSMRHKVFNEVLQWCRRKEKRALIFKVDFEKAYDSVRWDFLDDVLVKFGFGDKWRKWIQSCLKSSRGSILINGSPTKEFQFFKGLKQGDPLSPFLFILIMESLHLSFQRVVDAGLFTGMKFNSSTSLSHLFYADDAIFVGQWSDVNIDTLVKVLDCFFRASGLRINMCKSKLMVGDCMSTKHAWKEVVDKVVTRLSRWKMKTLSIGGRLTLLKSVLGSIPIFHMSIYKVPELKILQDKGINMFEFMRLNLGNGEGTRFWKDKWFDGGTMKVLFPRLYALEMDKMMTNIQLKPCDDRYVWSLNNSGEFSVASLRKVIDDNRFHKVNSSTRWVNLVPIKVNVIAWKVMSNALPTRFNISSRGMDIDTMECPICKEGSETSSHLFFQCRVVRQLTRKISAWWNVDHEDVNSYEEWRRWLVSLRIPSKTKGMLEGALNLIRTSESESESDAQMSESE